MEFGPSAPVNPRFSRTGSDVELSVQRGSRDTRVESQVRHRTGLGGLPQAPRCSSLRFSAHR